MFFEFLDKLFPPSLDQIVAVFARAQARLGAYAARLETKMDQLEMHAAEMREQAQRMNEKVDALGIKASRATQIADKLNQFIR